MHYPLLQCEGKFGEKIGAVTITPLPDEGTPDLKEVGIQDSRAVPGLELFQKGIRVLELEYIVHRAVVWVSQRPSKGTGGFWRRHILAGRSLSTYQYIPCMYMY